MMWALSLMPYPYEWECVVWDGNYCEKHYSSARIWNSSALESQVSDRRERQESPPSWKEHSVSAGIQADVRKWNKQAEMQDRLERMPGVSLSFWWEVQTSCSSSLAARSGWFAHPFHPKAWTSETLCLCGWAVKKTQHLGHLEFECRSLWKIWSLPM